jgi:Icc-related predicted phosphoesterase
MRIVIISDTHGAHENLGPLKGDVLIHCGDFENLFRQESGAIEQIDDWFGRQNFELILCLGGNHDLAMEKRVQSGQPLLKNATFLTEGEVIHRGVKFFGASWVPMLDGHAFFLDDERLEDAWDRIPDDVDVLMTHTPPAGILDVSSTGLRLGCKYLAARLKDLSPRLHCFGHVHASRGHRIIGDTTYLNATSVNSNFQIAHRPFEFEWVD